jgi:hypothetical protein
MPEQPPQLKQADLEGMTPEQIVKARKAGQLNEYLGIPAPPQPMTATTFTDEEGHPRGITAEDLKTMAPEEIVRARRLGRLRHLGYAPGGRR